MNRDEARSILRARVAELRREPYDCLKSNWLGKPDCEQITSHRGVEYQVEIEAFWDDETAGHLRLVALIDDGGWRALAPLADDFIIAADGSFVGE